MCPKNTDHTYINAVLTGQYSRVVYVDHSSEGTSYQSTANHRTISLGIHLPSGGADNKKISILKFGKLVIRSNYLKYDK